MQEFSWQVNVLVLLVLVPLNIFSVYQTLYSLLDHWWLSLEHVDLLNHWGNELIMDLNLSSLHDSHANCIDDHCSLLLDFSINISGTLTSTLTLCHLRLTDLRHQVKSDIIVCEFKIDCYGFLRCKLWHLQILLEQNSKIWMAKFHKWRVHILITNLSFLLNLLPGERVLTFVVKRKNSWLETAHNHLVVLWQKCCLHLYASMVEQPLDFPIGKLVFVKIRKRVLDLE